MFSVLVQNMIDRYEYPVVTAKELEPFLSAHELTLLFFTEDAKRFPETDDVAMILPELVKAFNGRFSVAVVALADQRTLQMHYGFKEWPTLVLLRRGGYLGAISRVQDWSVYLDRIEQILASEPTNVPVFIPQEATISFPSPRSKS